MTERTRKNLAYTLSTFAVEGLEPSSEAVRLYKRMEEGHLTLKETIAAIERKHGVAGEKRA